MSLKDLPALTIDQPWASLISIGEKTIENRDWHPGSHLLGMQIMIHASRTYDHLGAFELKVRRGIDCYAPHLPRGAMVAVARLTEVVTDADDDWFVGPYGWVLDQVQAIKPIPCAGNRGLWYPDQSLQHQVFAATEKPFDLNYYLRPPKQRSGKHAENILTF